MVSVSYLVGVSDSCIALQYDLHGRRKPQRHSLHCVQQNQYGDVAPVAVQIGFFRRCGVRCHRRTFGIATAAAAAAAIVSVRRKLHLTNFDRGRVEFVLSVNTVSAGVHSRTAN